MRFCFSLRTTCIGQNRQENFVPEMGPRPGRFLQWTSLARIVLVTGVLLSLALPVEAKIYRYRGPDGRLIISNSPPPAGSEVMGTSRERSPPSTLTTAPTATKPVLTPSQQRDREPSDFDKKSTKRKRQRKRRESTTSRPVDTHKFGLLEIGSSKVAVERRIGPPEKRIRHGKKKRTILHNEQYISRSVQIESWHYPGNSRILSTHLVFYDDRLAEKDKAR